MNYRAQTALEYLMMYGWVLIVLVLAVVGLFGLGLLNPATWQGKHATGFNSIPVLDHEISNIEGGVQSITLKLQSAEGKNVTLKKLYIDDTLVKNNINTKIKPSTPKLITLSYTTGKVTDTAYGVNVKLIVETSDGIRDAITGYLTGVLTGSPKAEWASALTNWTYRLPITIDNTANSNALSNYQVLIIPTASDLNFSHANANGNDIRFADVAGNELNYWIEKWNGGANTGRVWVKTTTLDASSINTIYMYYGNAGATTTSNGKNTFIAFDNFNTVNLDTTLWNTYKTPTQASGILTLNSGDGIATKTNHSQTIFGASVKWNPTNPGYVWWGWISNASSGSSPFILFDSGNQASLCYTTHANYCPNHLVPTNAYHTYYIKWNPNTLKWVYDGTEKYSSTENRTETLPYVLRNSSSANDVFVDWMFGAKYSDPEPTISFGTETTQT